MRTRTLRLTLACNQRCGFCTSRDDHHDVEHFGPARLREQIDDAAGRGIEELVLSGGEPTLRPELARLARRAKEGGIARIVVQTNAMVLAYPGRAAALREAGVDALLVHMPARGTLADAISGVPGGFEHTCVGIDRALTAGLEVSLAIPLLTANAASVGALIRWATARFAGLRGVVPGFVTEAPRGAIAELAAAVAACEQAALACRELGLGCKLDPARGLPPCAFRHRRRFAELLCARPGAAPARGAVRIAACMSCAVTDLCPGMPAAFAAAAATVAPISASQRRLVSASRGDSRGLARTRLGSRATFTDPDGIAREERIVRVHYRCNQDCVFCFVDRTVAAPPFERVRRAIDEAAEQGVALLSLSGGEPTMEPRLAEHIAHGRARGMTVALQTNATMLGDPERTAALADAGLQVALVSLHAATAATSDALTGRPGTFEQTLCGLEQILAHGVEVRCNCVITGANLRELPALPALLAERFATPPLLVLSWATPSTDLVPVSAEIIPRFSEARSLLVQTIAACRRFGVRWRVPEGLCGMPPCVLEPAWRNLEALPPLHLPIGGFVRAEACATCAARDRCPGVRTAYAELHGTAELRAITGRHVAGLDPEPTGPGHAV